MNDIPIKTKRLEIYYNTYNSKNEKEIKDAYEKWAPFYEWHIIDMGWDAPKLCSDLFVKYLNNTQLKILDVGAGTGLVGIELNKMVIPTNTIIDGIDLSIDMINIAKLKNSYNNLWIMNAEMMTLENSTYDGLICVGSLNFGHISPNVFYEFVRVIRKDGIICFSTRLDYYTISKNIQEELVSNNKWELLEKREYDTDAVKDMKHIHWCYKCLTI